MNLSCWCKIFLDKWTHIIPQMNRQNFLDCMYFIYFIRQKPAIKDFVIKVGVSTSKSIYIPYSEISKANFQHHASLDSTSWCLFSY